MGVCFWLLSWLSCHTRWQGSGGNGRLFPAVKLAFLPRKVAGEREGDIAAWLLSLRSGHTRWPGAKNPQPKLSGHTTQESVCVCRVRAAS